MHAIFHKIIAVELGSTSFEAETKPLSAGGSVRPGLGARARLRVLAAVLLALLSAVLAGALPAQAQSPSADGPSAPRQLAAATEDGGIVLNWSAPADNGASGIRHYQMRNAEGASIPSDTPWISVGSQTSGAFRQLTNGTLYTFEVRAVNDHGHGPAASIQAIPNIPTTVSVSPVQATVTEGADAVFRFSRVGRTAESLSVSFNVSGHWKIMSPLTRLLTFSSGQSQNTTVTFAPGETEATVALASEADSENEGDGEISVTIRNALEHDVGSAGTATVLVEDDDIPAVSIRWISPPMTVQGNTWVGSMVEGEDIEYEIECTGGTLAPYGERLRIPVHVREELNHPVFTSYGRDYKVRQPCSDQPEEGFLQSYGYGRQRYVGPDNGRIRIDILPQVRNMYDYPGYVLPASPVCYGSPDDVRFCPKFTFGSVTSVDIEVLNRNPTITVEAVDEEVNEGEPARFRLTRIWTSDWLNPDGLLGASTDVDFAISSVGGYVSSPQNGQETFGASETEIIVEIPTESDGVSGNDGQVTFEILAGSAETQAGNIGGHYEVYDHIDGITPPGGNSRMASVRILNRDAPGVEISETALKVPEGESRTYTARLASQPTGPVTVTLSAAGDPDVTVRPATLTFTPSTWNAAQTVTVSAAHDGDAADDAATVSHAPSGGGYDAVTVADVAVTVEDDDAASSAVALSVLPGTVDEDAGATAVEVTATLDAAPRTSDTDVSVTVSAGTAAADDFAAVPGFTLTIPAGETEGTASFSLAPVDDAVDEEAETVSVDGAVQGLTVTSAAVTIADDDERGVDVSASSLTVPEGGGGAYTARLASQPTGPVTVTLSAAGDPDVTVRPATLTFTPSTWNAAQTVTVSAAHDGDAADDAATVSHAPSGGGYDAVTVADVAVTVEDDDAASSAVALSVLPGTVDEDAGATAVEVTATLDAAPRTSDTDVSVTVSAGTAAADDFAAVPGFTLTIPAGETEGTASFSLAPVDDAVDEEAETVSVDGAVQGLTVTSAAVTIADDDERGVDVSASSLTVPEGGGGAYTARLASQPTGPVTVTLSAAGDPDVTVRPATLTFTPSTWNAAQTVTVSAAHDGDAADDAATVSHAPSGGGYDAVTVADVAVTVEDDDAASSAVALSVLPGTVDEDAGATAVEVTATLDAAPRTSDTDVSVTVSAGTAAADDFAAVPGFTLTIPAGETEGTASFSLAPVDDAVDEEAETVSVDGAVQGLTVTSAAVTIADDDERGVDVSASSLTVPEGGGGAYTARLASQPTGPVTVTLSAAGDPDVTVRPATLTFTPSTWNAAQTVTVSAAHDGDAADDAATVSHAPSGGGYDAVTVADVAVTVEDDDAASSAVALSVLPGTVDEDAGATAVEVTATLDAAPRTSDTDVSVTVSAGTAAADDFAAVPGFTLTIPAGETEGTASFSLAPVDDAIDEEAETVSVDGAVQGLTVTSATVTIADDDERGVDVSASSLTVPEGGGGAYTARLASQPTGPVTVTLSAAGDPDVTVRPATLTFTPSTWNAAQTVTVSAAHDGDAADDAATVSHAPSGGGYDAVTVADVAVTVEDDDAALQAPELTVAWPGFEQVRLAWTAPTNGQRSITGYEVHVERVDDGSVVHDWEPAGATLEHTVTGLENEVEYRFRVRAVQQSGPGAPSNALTAAPVPLVLTIVPYNDTDTIVEGELARFEILLSGPLTHWIELDVRYTYTGEMMLDPISRDTTQYGPRPQESILPRVVATLDDSAIEPDGSVTLSLLPGDGYGIGELSSATIRVLDNDGGRAPTAPAAPTVGTLSPTVIEATWHPPSDPGNPGSIDSYDVQYRKSDATGWLDGPVGVVDTRAVLEGLEAGTSYEVRVLARNARNPRNPDSVHAENWSGPGTGSTAPSSAVTVSVAEPSGSPQATEGDVLAFIVTADPPPASDLRVAVAVSESGAMLLAPLPSEVTIAAGTGEAVLDVATVDDAVHETASQVFVAIAPGSGYDRGEAVASRHVSDNDPSGPDGAPGKPLNPHAEPMSDTELRLTWDWPQDIARDQVTSWVVMWTVEPCGQASPSWAAAQSLPAGDGDPTEFVLTPGRAAAAHFRVAALLADAHLGPWSEAVCADTTANSPFEVEGARVVNDPGSNGTWDAGETVEAEIVFNRPVWVDDSNGRPSLAIVLDGARREAPWVGGGGTPTLRFAYPVTANEAGARVARVLPNGLSLNGATILDAEGRRSPDRFDVTPVVTAVTVEAEADGLWSPGDAVHVHVAFNERVTVDTQGGWPSLGVVAGAAPEARAVYAGGSGTRTLLFAHAVPEAAAPASSVVVLANSLALEGGVIHRGGVAADLRHPWAHLDATSSGAVPALSVADASAAEGGRLAFAVTLDPASLETVTVAYATSDGSASAGTDYARAAGRLTFAPGQTQALAEVAVHADSIDEGVETLTFTLSGPSGAEIAKAQATGRVVDASALTASFEDAPEEHGGSNVFGFRLVFSEPVFNGNEPFDKNRAIRDALRVSGGTVRGGRRVNPGAFDQWILWIRPSGHGDVTVSLPATTGGCDIAGAICTPDGRALANAPAVTIRGLPGLSVADVAVQEGPGAALAFPVTLSRASSGQVTVDYATADGSATAGSDYVATNGTLTFEAGETVKTVAVPVLDDAIDEGSENLTLTLSNPSGNARLADATATGTIRNSDLMPQAWLTRFGGTVAEQVLDAVQGRLQGPPAVGVQVTLAGERVVSPAASGGEEPGSGSMAGSERRDGYRPVPPHELLTGSSFQFTSRADGADGDLVSIWGRGARSSFDGREGDLSLSGEVTSALVGADWSSDRWTAGVLLSHALGEGSYRGASFGKVESALTGLYPYGRYELTDRVTAWGTAGYGAGTLTLRPEERESGDGAAMRTDMDLMMAAAGLRGVVVRAPAEGGPEVSVETDALAVRTRSGALGTHTGNLAAATGDATRLRFGLEGTWHGLSVAGGKLKPRLEFGIRHDGGDAETGFALDAGAGLAWSRPENGLRLQLAGRGLLDLESKGFREKGVAGSLAWQPDGEGGRGPSLAVTRTLGGASSGGVDALLGRRTLAGLAVGNDGDPLESRSSEVRFGYGFAALGGGFTSTPELGFGMSNGRREYSLGWRLNRDGRGDAGSVEFAIEATRRESADDHAGATPEHKAGFRFTARW